MWCLGGFYSEGSKEIKAEPSERRLESHTVMAYLIWLQYLSTPPASEAAGEDLADNLLWVKNENSITMKDLLANTKQVKGMTESS